VKSKIDRFIRNFKKPIMPMHRFQALMISLNAVQRQASDVIIGWKYNSEDILMTVLNLLTGSRLSLTTLSAADAVTLARWQGDNEFLRLLDAYPAYPKNEVMVSEWIRNGQQAKDHFLFGIRIHATDSLIGFLELGEVLWTHRTTWLSIAIGERSYWGQGYGYEAVGLALEFAFRELNLHRVQLTVFSYNERAIRLYEKLGFRREGVFREFLERDTQRHDMYLYGMLRSEWLD
jgi:RimJ/RimL family protein N-acetyltransferase